MIEARLEAAEAKAREIEAVRAERDSWRSEAQALQTRMASDSSEREELRHQLEATQQQLVEEREAVRAAGARLHQESAALQTARADLAARMGVSPGRVSQILGGGENLTLRTLAALSTALDARFDVDLNPLKAEDSYTYEAALATNHHAVSRARHRESGSPPPSSS